MIYPHYEPVEREQMLAQLTEEQRSFLKDHLRRGRKNVFDRQIYEALSGDAVAEEEVKAIISQWEFIDYIDHGKQTNKVKCFCGASLRYQYIVKNKRTGEEITFGSGHFEQHTHIPTKIVSKIKSGISDLDYELDEILHKIMVGWDSTILEAIEDYGLEVSGEVEELIRLSLPLLDRHITRLRKNIKAESDKRRIELEAEIERERKQAILTYMESMKERAATANTGVKGSKPRKITQVPQPSTIEKMFELELHAQAEVKYLLDKYEIVDVRQICEELSYLSNPGKEVYLTGKPKIYPKVAHFLDQLAEEGYCKLVDVQGTDNRTYAKTY